MIKVTIFDDDENEPDVIKTEMPILPEISEFIGYWVGGEWRIKQVHQRIYEFNVDGSFMGIEITVSEKPLRQPTGK